MISAFGVDHEISKKLPSALREQYQNNKRMYRNSGLLAPKGFVVSGMIHGPEKSARYYKHSRISAHAAGKSKDEITRATGRMVRNLSRGALKKNAFGVDHGISKRVGPKRLPDWASAAVPASTADAYNNSQRHKARAGAANLAAKLGGGAVGSAIGATAVGLLARKYPGLKAPLKVGRATVSGERKLGAAQALGAGAVGGVVGGVAGARSLNRIKGDKSYRYKRS